MPSMKKLSNELATMLVGIAMRYFFVNGKFLPENEAKISIWDRQFNYGDGVFDFMIAIDGRIFDLESHINRLYTSAQRVDITVPMTREEMKKIIIETLRKSKVDSALVKVNVSRGVSLMTANPREVEKGPMVAIFHADYKPSHPLDTGLIAITLPHKAYSSDPRIKSTSRLHIILAKLQASRQNVDDAILLSENGFVTEATTSNIFIYSNRILYTPPTIDVLEGTTRSIVINKLSKEINIPVRKKLLRPYDIYTADEVFLTATSYGVAPVVEIDGKQIGEGQPGPVAMKLQELYQDLIRSGKMSTEIYRENRQ